MQVQSIAFMINDPLMLPCSVARFASAVDLIQPAEATAAGVGYFEMGEPLVAKVRPPTTRNLQSTISRLYANALVATTARSQEPDLHSYDVQPFRYRNWFFAMAGHIPRYFRAADKLLAMPSYIEKNIRGKTVAEVLFHQFLAYLHRQGLLAGDRYDMAPLRKALSSALSHGKEFFGEHGEKFSMVLTDGRVLLGASLERPVYMRRLNGLDECLSCGGDVDGLPVCHDNVRGVVLLDTEELPSEEWTTVGPRRLFQVTPELEFESFAM